MYNCSYFSSNVDVSGMIALSTSGPYFPGLGTNVPQFWDFSAPQQSYETTLRTDIIALEDGNNSDQFPDADYAEQDTIDSTNLLGWRYYGFDDTDTNTGRLLCGLDAPENMPVTEWAAFVPPIVDIPSTVQLGQTWSGSTYWLSAYFEILLISNNCTFSATADALGTLALPGIGGVPALRVHAVESYTISDVSSPPLLLDISTNDYYYWLVPGIGVAAEVLVMGNNTLYPTSMCCTNTVQRMFYTSYYTNSVAGPTGPSGPPFPADLFIQLQNESAILNWNSLSNAVNYRIDYSDYLGTGWQPLGYTNGMSWTDTVTASQRFYRVVGIP